MKLDKKVGIDTSSLVEFQGDLSVDAERKVVVDDAERQRVAARVSLRVRLVIGGRRVGVALHLQLPAVKHHRLALLHARQDLGYRLVRIALHKAPRPPMGDTISITSRVSCRSDPNNNFNVNTNNK